MKQTAKRAAVAVGALSTGVLFLPGSSQAVETAGATDMSGEDRLAQAQKALDQTPFGAAHQSPTAALQATGPLVVDTMKTSLRGVGQSVDGAKGAAVASVEDHGPLFTQAADSAGDRLGLDGADAGDASVADSVRSLLDREEGGRYRTESANATAVPISEGDKTFGGAIAGLLGADDGDGVLSESDEPQADPMAPAANDAEPSLRDKVATWIVQVAGPEQDAGASVDGAADADASADAAGGVDADSAADASAGADVSADANQMTSAR
ncbi:hypothetical protein [Salininema proteolyticum]|uniref:Uncharacterized protein n=1 Tax=Salininema proteolyticum TaxID=1607685 RepID=A0ABV8U3H9_9ACTN